MVSVLNQMVPVHIPYPVSLRSIFNIILPSTSRRRKKKNNIKKKKKAGG
jgi:hypothetical protein